MPSFSRWKSFPSPLPLRFLPLSPWGSSHGAEALGHILFTFLPCPPPPRGPEGCPPFQLHVLPSLSLLLNPLLSP